jgi:hypothetical protein
LIGTFTNHDLGVITNGTTKMTILSGGNVGIGNTSPNMKLVVTGTSAAAGDTGIVGITDGTGVNTDTKINFGVVSGTYGWIQAVKPGTNVFPLLLNPNGGNIGIGTTSSPYKLSVAGDVQLGTGQNRSVQYDSNGGNFRITANAGGWATGYFFNGSSGTFRGGFGGFGNANDLGYYWIGGDYNAATMYVTSGSSGMVGINTSSPYDSTQYSLDVNGGLLIKNTGKTAQLVLQNADPAAGGNNGFIIHTAGGTTTGAFAAMQTYYGASVAAGTLRLQPSAGNVGIGTTSAADKLTVAGNLFLSGSGRSVWLTNNADSGDRLRLHQNGIYGYIDFASGDLYFRASTTTVVSFSSGGTITAAGDVVAYGTPSDASFKTNIVPIQGSLDKIQKLEPVSFTWKEETESNKLANIKDDLGFIAQQVQEVLPELVRENDNGTLSLRERGIIPLLVGAIKEQQKQIDELKYLLKNK